MIHVGRSGFSVVRIVPESVALIPRKANVREQARIGLVVLKPLRPLEVEAPGASRA